MKYQWWALWVFALLLASPVMAAEELTSGQALYLPVYSHIWYGDRRGSDNTPSMSLVSVLVSIRNTSLRTPIRVTSARYYSTEGKLLREYLVKPVLIGVMGTHELFVERKESDGGSGANFVIQWDSASATNSPVVEALHADIKSGNHALTFITTGHPIQADK